MKNPNGPSREEVESWHDEQQDREARRLTDRMTARELYDAVKDHPEVWRDHLVFDRKASEWLDMALMSFSWYAEIVLEGLFSRKTGCIAEAQTGEDGDFGAWTWESERMGDGGPTRLHALVAAYASQKEQEPKNG
jgi:hypothetical protein